MRILHSLFGAVSPSPGCAALPLASRPNVVSAWLRATTKLTRRPAHPSTEWWRCLRLFLLLLAMPLPVQAQFPLPDSFNPGTDDGVLSLALQADGKILVGGWFTALGGQTRNNIGRLNTDGA